MLDDKLNQDIESAVLNAIISDGILKMNTWTARISQRHAGSGISDDEISRRLLARAAKARLPIEMSSETQAALEKDIADS